MSYILYINGNKMDIESSTISQTRQVNDLAKLDNRQSSFTNKFTLPFTPNNVRNLDFIYLAGNQSFIPYSRLDASLYDGDSGACLLYKGWATLQKSTKKGYEVYIYDGLVDFYRAIENQKLSDMDVSELNHAKSIDNIVGSWANDRPYIYAISDYNGKNSFTTVGGTPIVINTDYQIPSARVSYIWNRVLEFAGFTYSGSYFATADFLNLFMTFPKPVPYLVPNRLLIHLGYCYPRHSTYQYYDDGGSLISAENYLLTLPRENFSYPEAKVDNNNEQTGLGPNGDGSLGYIYKKNPIKILQNGLYSIDAYAPNIDFTFSRHDANGNIIENGQTELDASGNFKTHIFTCNAGETIELVIQAPESTLQNLNFKWQLNRIDGYVANFQEALVDFSITDFVKEIITAGALTAFKDKYRNHIEFLTISEVLQTSRIKTDWKFQYKDGEAYRVGQYAQLNNFRYRYNDENMKFNNGALAIADVNLPDTVDVFNSKTYSPEQRTVQLFGKSLRVFKIWEKELQDDGTIEYNDLTGRFYFLRFELSNISTILASESLNQEQAVTQVGLAKHTRLSFNEILYNYYGPIGSLFDKAKAIDMYFYLTPIQIADFDFKSLVYVEELGSYYLVNRILNFSKGKITKCEVFEVDYLATIEPVDPPVNPVTGINITGYTTNGCSVTVTFTTDASVGTSVDFLCELNNFGIPGNGNSDPLYTYAATFVTTGFTNTFTFTLQAGALYQMHFSIVNLTPQPINSNYIYFDNTGSCSVVSPVKLQIKSASLTSQNSLTQTYSVTFDVDNGILPRNLFVRHYKVPTPIDPDNPFAGSYGGWSEYDNFGTIGTPAFTYSFSRIHGDATQFQIKIGTKESNIYNL